MATTDGPGKQTLRERIRSWRRKRRERAVDRARTRPDMESYAEGAAFREAGRRNVRDP